MLRLAWCYLRLIKYIIRRQPFFSIEFAVSSDFVTLLSLLCRNFMQYIRELIDKRLYIAGIEINFNYPQRTNASKLV
eukprot:19415_5